MKKTLILLVLFLFSILISFNSYSGSYDNTVCVETDAQIRNDIVYLPNKTKPFTGSNLCEYENGHFKSKGNLKDGKRYGKWNEWHENGQIWSDENFKNGKKYGKWTEWHENGQIKAEGNYKYGKPDGKVTHWYKENGKIGWVKYYKDGTLVSETKYGYYENNQIKAEGNYKDNKLDGTMTYWHENGQIKAEQHYKRGKVDGKVTYWHENGQIKAEQHYKDDKCISGDCNLLLSFFGIQEEYSRVMYFLKYLYKNFVMIL